jgi:hypothetical protein
MPDLFSTDVLTRVVASLLGNPQFLLDRYFGTVQTELSEDIHFDTLDGKRRISPFVSPLVEGQIITDKGFKTATLRPAYIKYTRVFDMNRPLKRSPGEQIGGTLNQPTVAGARGVVIARPARYAAPAPGSDGFRGTRHR